MADDRPLGGAAPAAGLAPPSSSPKLDPCAFVIFGAFGDLASRLVTPALYNLECAGRLPEAFAVIGVDHADADAGAWRDHLHTVLESFVGDPTAEFSPEHLDEEAWGRLAARMTYQRGDLTQPDVYAALGQALSESQRRNGAGDNALFHLAVADRLFGPVIEGLGKAGLADQSPGEQGGARRWRRVIVEKPFGHDLASAQALNQRIGKVLDEPQIFRIDHFLGKDAVQAIAALRFANGVFEPLWNRDHIDHVQITAAETVGVEARGAFYEGAGALRDMVPNHLLSLLCMAAMEPPAGFGPDASRQRKAEVLAAMPPADPAQAVRGQYGAGQVAGAPAKAYRAEPRVAPDSKVETYVALRLEVANWRWAGVPFYLRTGKHMGKRLTEIAVQFKPAPLATLAVDAAHTPAPNWLIISIAPDESVSLQFDIRPPGGAAPIAPVRMAFRYDDWFPKDASVGYETLLADAMAGDQTLFMRADMAEEGWRIVQPLLDAWAGEAPADFPNYASGSTGPASADALLARDGRAWRSLEEAVRPGAAGKGRT